MFKEMLSKDDALYCIILFEIITFLERACFGFLGAPEPKNSHQLRRGNVHNTIPLNSMKITDVSLCMRSYNIKQILKILTSVMN